MVKSNYGNQRFEFLFDCALRIPFFFLLLLLLLLMCSFKKDGDDRITNQPVQATSPSFVSAHGKRDNDAAAKA